MPEAAQLRDAAAALLDYLAGQTGDPRFSHAAGVLKGKRAGRPPVDDGAPLSLAGQLFAAGAFKSRRAACDFVATMYADSHRVDAMRDRLQRKLRRK